MDTARSDGEDSLCIPSYVRDEEMVGDTIEILSFFSDDVKAAYYERVLGKQSADTPNDRKMLEIVWDGICSEFVQAYYNVVPESRILYVFPDLTRKTPSRQNTTGGSFLFYRLNLFHLQTYMTQAKRL